jgi:plastocyanin
MRAPRARIALMLSAVSAALVGCGDAPERHELDMRALGYQPVWASARTGDTLVWTNHDLVPHTVTEVAGAWDSGPVAPGASWRLVLESGRDTVAYACIYHPTMTGSVVVQ